jgi:hypothetical protein
VTSVHDPSQAIWNEPSRVTEQYWLFAAGPDDDPHEDGKWLIFVPPSRVDVAWRGIVEALRTGRLSRRAKVSTARPRPTATGPEHVIVVYTRDDATELRRVLRTLRDLGHSGVLFWKSDAATSAQRYGRDSWTYRSPRGSVLQWRDERGRLVDVPD